MNDLFAVGIGFAAVTLVLIGLILLLYRNTDQREALEYGTCKIDTRKS